MDYCTVAWSDDDNKKTQIPKKNRENENEKGVEEKGIKVLMTTVTKCNQFSSNRNVFSSLSFLPFVIDVKHFALTCLLIIGSSQMMD